MNNNEKEYPAMQHNGNGNGTVTLYHIYETLGKLVKRLENEMTLQQSIIRKQLKEIEALKAEMKRKEGATVSVNKKLEEAVKQVEGNRQLINKLLSDITHYQNDIDWYRRTYEKRSIWGVIKDKLTRGPDLKEE